MCDSTYHGLIKWYPQLIEKFSWIIIKMNDKCDEDYKNYKVNSYLKSIDHFLFKVKNKIDTLEDPDNKKDLVIIYNKVLEFKNSILTFPQIQKYISQSGGKKGSKKSIKK